MPTAGELGYFSYGGYDGSAWVVGVQLIAQAGSQWSTSNHNATLALYAVPAQSTAVTAIFRFNSNSDNGGDYNCNASQLSLSLAIGKQFQWTTSASGYEGNLDTNISRVAAGTIAVGNGTQSNASGTVQTGILQADYVNLVVAGAPDAPTITNGGATGVATWSYVLVGKDAQGNLVASNAGSTTTGNATLSSGNFNIITVSSQSTGAVTYDVYRTVVGTSPTTTGKIGTIVPSNTTGNVLNDTGLAGNSAAVPANTVTSGINNAGTYTDSTGAVGTSGQLLSSTVTGTAWVPAPTGFVNPMTTLGDIIYENATPAAARLAGNTTTTKEYLSQTGNGTISAAPAWAQVNYADIAGTTPTPPSGAVLWSSLGNAGANLTLSNAGYTTTFNQTSAVAWLWANTTVGTSSRPTHHLCMNSQLTTTTAQHRQRILGLSAHHSQREPTVRAR